jgi:uncharacterized protein YajQ (UPF0234 family)|tara:strand:- start:3145 stop:3639 length:495 start_codon:yes stop_codon:yes gene_type:complete
MPSFDISSEANMVNIKNAVDVSSRMIDNRYDFKGSSGKVELLEKEMTINVYGDSDFQLNQIKDILFPAMEKKEPDSSRRIVSNEIEQISGNKAKQSLSIQTGIDIDLAKQIVKTIKESKMKLQASIQGDSVRISGAKKDLLQDGIALVKANHKDFPLNFGNFRD